MRYDSGDLNIVTSIYHTEINDIILDQLGGGSAPQDRTFYENVGTLETQGFELSASYQWHNVNFTMSYSNNDSELNNNTVEGYENIGVANARGGTWNVNLIYIFSVVLAINISKFKKTLLSLLSQGF